MHQLIVYQLHPDMHIQVTVKRMYQGQRMYQVQGQQFHTVQWKNLREAKNQDVVEILQLLIIIVF